VAIAAGPDGALWFVEVQGDRVGRITTDGTFSEFATSSPSSHPFAIAAGALECLARAGRDARTKRNELLSARRAAEDFIEGGWEPDVPHANVLGQALSTIAALDDDPPADCASTRPSRRSPRGRRDTASRRRRSSWRRSSAA
jgi:hypothetical protein